MNWCTAWFCFTVLFAMFAGDKEFYGGDVVDYVKVGTHAGLPGPTLVSNSYS
eukprot:COSAG01_NODE_49_length_31891_cov_29.945773_5_plen_52_part_00